MKVAKVRIAMIAVAAALLGVALFGGLASAQALFVARSAAGQAQQTGPHPVRLLGKISSISGNTLVLTTKQGTFTVDLDANTWIVVKKNGVAAQGVASDLQTGKAAAVAGVTTSDPTVVNARVVTQGALGNLAGKVGRVARGRLAIARHTASGTITAINGSTITLKGVKVQQVIVQTGPDTVVLNNGFASVGSLKVGDSVQVLGSPVANGTPGGSGQQPTPGSNNSAPASRTLTAWALRVDNGTSKLMVARVTAVNGNVLTVKTAANKAGFALNLTTSTGFKTLTVTGNTRSLTSASAADVKVGSNLLVEATPGADGKTFTASAVIILPGKIK